MRLSSEIDVVSRAQPRAAGSRAAAATGPGPLERSRDRGAPITACHRFVAVCLAAALLAGCDPVVQGNGVYAEESRGDLVPFEGVHSEDGVATFVTVTGAGQPQTVQVSGDANLVRHVRTRVVPEGELQVLHVAVEIGDEFSPTIPLRVVINVPTFSSVWAAESTEVLVKRAASAPLTGGGLSVTLDTAALDAAAYPVSGAVVALTGAALAKLQSTGPVTGSAANTSKVLNVGSGDCAGVDLSEAACACAGSGTVCTP
jgi:hypothetical protein